MGVGGTTALFKDRSANVSVAESAISTWVTTTRPANMHACDSFTQARLIFVGAGSAGNTGTAQLYTVDFDKAPPATPTTYFITHFCTVIATYGTATGVADGIIVATDLIADGLALTDVGNLPYDASFGGDTSVYNSTANDIGQLVTGSLGGADGLFVRYTALTTITNMNSLLKLVPSPYG